MLFDLPLLPGLRFREELIGRDEEAALISEIEQVDLSPFRFQGWTGKRMTRTYGWRYDFDDRSFQPVEETRSFGLPPLLPEPAAALGLHIVGRGTAGMGAQHRSRRASALFDHLPDAVRQGSGGRRPTAVTYFAATVVVGTSGFAPSPRMMNAAQ